MFVQKQVQPWSLGQYLRDVRDGYIILYQGLRDNLLHHLSKARRSRSDSSATHGDQMEKSVSRNSSSLTSSSALSIRMQGSQAQLALLDDDQHPTTLHYSFLILGKMLNLCVLYIPGFVLSLRLGFIPTRLYVIFNYLSLLVFAVIGIVLARFTIAPSIEIFVRKMSDSLREICISATMIGQTGYIIYGLTNCGYILYQREFLQRFIYNRCSLITLARSYQRRQVVFLFLAINSLSFLSEPLFALLALIQDVKQPEYWPTLSPGVFLAVKCAITIFLGTGAAIIGSGGVVVPLMTCYLIVSTTKHLKNLVKKQSNRYNQSVIWSQTSHNEELESLVNYRTRRIMVDFACETLTMDWPDMIGQSTSDELSDEVASANPFVNPDERMVASNWIPQRLSLQSKSSRSSNSTGSSGSLQNISSTSLNLVESKLSSSKASSLMFLYKNLIKNMSELKGMIVEYERHFGNFHQIASLISCLIVSLWVTAALTELRQSTAQEKGPRLGASSGVASNKEERERQTHTLRIIGSTISFTVSNIFIFLKCDCLSDRIIKIKSQLFKMNIDLACTMIAIQRKRALQQQPVAPTAITVSTIMPQIRIQCEAEQSRTRSSICELTSAHSSPVETFWTRSIYKLGETSNTHHLDQYVNQCPELDQIWSLYDQVERISGKVNFKFSSETYYSKRCMLLVFGRGVSLILFFIQIIDMYSS